MAVPLRHDAGAAGHRRSARVPVRSDRRARSAALAAASLTRGGSDRALVAELRDFLSAVTQPQQHRVGVLAQARGWSLDARSAVGELERGQRDGPGPLDALDRAALLRRSI